MDGVITYSTVKNPITDADTLVGLKIDDILSPPEARNYKMALMKAAFCGDYEWYIYTVKSTAFLALVEYLKVGECFMVYEAQIIKYTKDNIAYLKERLFSMSGRWHETFHKNGTE